MITYERQKDGTLKQVDSPPKRAELVEQRIYDRCIVRVGQLEAEKAALETRIDELCAEVERLRGQGARLFDKTLELGTENSTLRELVYTIYMCSNIRCDQCEYGHGNTCAFDAESELNKLGIEVGE